MAFPESSYTFLHEWPGRYQSRADSAKMEVACRMKLMKLEPWGSAPLVPLDWSTLDTINYLGFICITRGNFVEAEALLQRAIKGFALTMGHDHAETLSPLHNLGILKTHQLELLEAEALLKRVVKGWTEALGAENALTLTAANHLGHVYLCLDKLVEAEEMFHQTLLIQRSVRRNEGSWLRIANAAKSLGKIYQAQGKLAQAESMYQEALEGYEDVLGPRDISTLEVRRNLADLYKDHGKRQEARKMYQEVINGFQILLDDHTLILKAQLALSHFHPDGILSEAEATFQQTVEKELSKLYFSLVGAVEKNRDGVSQHQGKSRGAKFRRQEVFQTQDSTLPNRTSTLDAINDPDPRYIDKGMLMKAEAAHRLQSSSDEKVQEKVMNPKTNQKSYQKEGFLKRCWNAMKRVISFS